MKLLKVQVATFRRAAEDRAGVLKKFTHVDVAPILAPLETLFADLSAALKS